MSCKYILMLSQIPCGRLCQDEYCGEHQPLIDAVDELDRELLQAIRERRK